MNRLGLLAAGLLLAATVAKADTYNCVFKLQGAQPDQVKFDTDAAPQDGIFYQATYFMGVVDTQGFGNPSDKRIELRATRAATARFELGARELYLRGLDLTIQCRKN